MQETVGQITYAVISSPLGASELVLGAIVAAGFVVSGVRTFVTRDRTRPGWDEHHA